MAAGHEVNVVLAIVIARVFWRIVSGFMQGLNGGARPQTRVPRRGVSMVRDPVCGTFILPERAVTVVEGRTRIQFCSEACRDSYRARTA